MTSYLLLRVKKGDWDLKFDIVLSLTFKDLKLAYEISEISYWSRIMPETHICILAKDVGTCKCLLWKNLKNQG